METSVKIGDRVEIPPHYDRWMMGDRYGEVVKISGKFIRVKMDRSNKVCTFLREGLRVLA